MSRARIHCNECDSKATVTSTNKISKLVTHLYCQCTNVYCGHTFRLSQSFDHTISPPAGKHEQLVLGLLQDLPSDKRKEIINQLVT
ncbi:ogr/Delta-like zinc finger family protein [Algicola sagamiensis]|uniref:ogr/Delta-like zinc finger family protein n=1 Tax=Algicola sagamiensis TaxID=163869 RepID=UPI0012FA470F|nr:ogr/Delta-like zinc finger family protein [Algicola sagamiensis]